MTVCIAAIAAKSTAVVCIADRALTYTGYAANSETDSGVTKIIDLPGINWCAMFSGDDLTFPKRILDRVFASLADEPNGSSSFMESTVKAAFNACWEDEVEDQILRPNLLTKADFVSRASDVQPLDPQLVMKIAETIAQFKLDCAMIFCGFDGEIPHIFMASTPGRIDPCDWQGFAVIGGGTEAARNQMLWQEHEKDDPLESVLYDVFSSKVATEVIQGVGYEWDWRVLVAGKKPQSIPDKIDKLIDKLWVTQNMSPLAGRFANLKSHRITGGRLSQLMSLESWHKRTLNEGANSVVDGQNSTNSTPSFSKCFRFSVAIFNPCTRAVAAIRKSVRSRFKPTLCASTESSPAKSATTASTGNVRLPYSMATSAPSHTSRSRLFLPSGSLSTPRRSSANVIALKNVSLRSTVPSQVIASLCGLFLAVCEIRLVSSRYLRSQPLVASL